MPLPPELIAVQERIRQAEAALHAYVESGEHDSNQHRRLVENLQRAIREYEDRIASLLRDISLRA
jgi:hypothetical protein